MVKRIFVALLLIVALQAGGHSQTTRPELWVSTWGTALIGRPAPAPAPSTSGSPSPPPAQAAQQRAPVHIKNQTIRQIVHTSVGGSRLRVVLSNAWGTAPIVIGAAHVALRGGDPRSSPSPRVRSPSAAARPF